MAKFLQKSFCSIYNLPIIARQIILPKYDELFVRHIGYSISGCNFSINLESETCLLKNVLKQKSTPLDVHRNLSTTTPRCSKNFYSVTFVLRNGEKQTVKGKDGDSLLDVVKNNNVDIPGFGACEGTISCSTCHFIFKEDDFKKIESPCTDEELDILTTAHDFCDTRKVNCLSLSGSGFLGLYLIGAAEYLQHHHHKLLDHISYAGSSAGALVASGLACNVSLRTARIAFLRTAAVAQESYAGLFGTNFFIQDHLRRGLENLPNDAHTRANGRLFVSLTRVRDWKNVVISEWNSREELIETILCSCFIPGVSGTRLPSLNGTFYIDGGFTNGQPTPLPNSLTVCPYPGKTHICPKQNSNSKMNLFYLDHDFIHRHYRSMIPSPPHEMMAFYWEGYRDARSFMEDYLASNLEIQ